MAKRGRHRTEGRTTPRGTRSPRGGDHHRSSSADHNDEPDLITEVRRRLHTDNPLDLLAEVSGLVAAVDPRSKSPFERQDPGAPGGPTLEELVNAFADADQVETTALLAGIAQLAPDELVRARARRAMGARRHALPGWLQALDQAEPDRTMEMVHVLGDGDNIIIGLRLTGGHVLSMVSYVDHNLGTVAKDGFIVPGPIDELVAHMRRLTDDPDTQWRDLDPADARARITQAIDAGAMTLPPLESETWPACRPLIEWATRLLPANGNGYQRPDWDEAATEALAERFFASSLGAPYDDPEHRGLLGSILWFGTDYGPGDPLRWSPVAVEMLLADWIPRKIVADADFLSKAPEVLRAFIRYCHHERSIRPTLTDQTLAAVDTWEPGYQATIRLPRPQGPMALLAAVGALDPDGQWEVVDVDPTWDESYDDDAVTLDFLRQAVGGEEALAHLDDHPLPDEPFDWTGIPDDVRPAVAEILDLCDACCDQLLDVEYRTACRRYLGRVAAGDARVFRRRASAEKAAAAVCWTVGKANDLFDWAGGGMMVKDLLAQFGLQKGSVSQRAGTLMKAAGVVAFKGFDPAVYVSWDIALGSPRSLVSSYRRRIIDERDRLGAG